MKKDKYKEMEETDLPRIRRTAVDWESFILLIGRQVPCYYKTLQERYTKLHGQTSKQEVVWNGLH